MKYLCFRPQDGWTALHMAAQEGKHDVVRLLTEAKAHVDIQTEVHTLYHIWCRHTSSQLMEEDIHGYAFLVDIKLCTLLLPVQ